MLAAGVLPDMAGLGTLISEVHSKKRRKQEGNASHSIKWHVAVHQLFLNRSTWYMGMAQPSAEKCTKLAMTNYTP